MALIELSVSPRDAGCHVIVLSFPNLDDLFSGLTVHTRQFDDLDFRQGRGISLCLYVESGLLRGRLNANTKKRIK